MTGRSKTGIIFHGFPENPRYRENLIFFLATACRQDLEIILLIAGEHEIDLPQLGNLSCIQTPNLGHDLGSLSFALKQGLDLSRYDKIIAINSSARGPFLPPYYHGSWTHPFTDQLRGETHLCGATLNILKPSSAFFANYQHAHEHAPPYSHVQTYAYAMTQECFQYLSGIGIWGEADAMTKEEAVIHCEIRMSMEVKQKGWAISCLLPTYNWLEEEMASNKQPPGIHPGHPAIRSRYHGTTLHPYDAIFIKTEWGIIEDEALDLYSLIVLKTRPSNLCRSWPEANSLLQRLEERYRSKLQQLCGPANPAQSLQDTPPEIKPNRRCQLVLGMHRSGTSALAGALTAMGCQGPKHPMDADQHNPLGFFESQKIMELNQDILRDLGRSWFDHQAYDWGQINRLRAKFLEPACELILQEFGNAELMVLKDPRIDRLLPFWIHVLQTTDHQITPLIIVRHPDEVARSLESRNAMDPAYAKLLWLRHVLEAERGTRGFQRTFLSFDQLLDDPQQCLIRIADQHRINWPASKQLNSITAGSCLPTIVQPALRHHNRSTDDQHLPDAVDDPLRDWLEEAYLTMMHLAQGKADHAQFQRLDTILQKLNEASAVLGRLVQHQPSTQ